jgi:hypothetical protein
MTRSTISVLGGGTGSVESGFRRERTLEEPCVTRLHSHGATMPSASAESFEISRAIQPIAYQSRVACNLHDPYSGV